LTFSIHDFQEDLTEDDVKTSLEKAEKTKVKIVEVIEPLKGRFNKIELVTKIILRLSDYL